MSHIHKINRFNNRMNLWIHILFFILCLVSWPAFAVKPSDSVKLCLTSLQQIPTEIPPAPPIWSRLFGSSNHTLPSPLQQMIKKTDALYIKIATGEMNQFDASTKNEIDALVVEGLTAAQASQNDSRIILAMAKLHVATKKTFEPKNEKLEVQVKRLNLENQWNNAIAHVLSREEFTVGYKTKRVSEYQPIDLGSPEGGPDGYHYLERARRLMSTHGITSQLIVDGKLDLSNGPLLQVAKILHAAKAKERPYPRADILAADYGEAALKNHLDSLLKPAENELALAYENTLKAEKAKNPKTETILTHDDVIHAELKALFSPKNPQRDNPGFNPHMTFVNRLARNPGRYREVINNIMFHRPPEKPTDTEHDRLFLHVPGLFRLTLEGEYIGTGAEATMDVMGFEYYDYQTEKFGDFHVVEKELPDGSKKKKWEGDPDNQTCILKCHLKSGEPAGSFAFGGTTVRCPVMSFVNVFLK